MTDGDNNANQNAIISELVKSSIEQAQKSHKTFVEMSERVRPDAVDANEKEFNEKALGLAKYDAAEHFKLALNLNDMTDEQAAISYHDDHTKTHCVEMAKRVADLHSLVNSQSETADPITEPEIEPAATDVIEPTPGDSPMTQAAVSSAALAGVMGTAAIVGQASSSEAIEAATPALVEPIATIDEPVSEEHMEAEIEALASKIHDVENIETDTPEVREFDSELVEPIDEEPKLEDVPELEAAPIDEEVAEVEVATPVVEEVAEVEVAAPVVEEVAELEVATPVAEEVAELEVAAPVVEEVAEVEVAAPVIEGVVLPEVAAPVVEEVAELEVAAPVVEGVVLPEVAAPVVEEVAELEATAPVIEGVVLPEVAAPVIEEVAEVEATAPVVEEMAVPEVAASVVEAVAELEVAAPIAEMAAVPDTQEPAIDPKSFDTDLAARLDAVRAMLQGSTQ